MVKVADEANTAVFKTGPVLMQGHFDTQAVKWDVNEHVLQLITVKLLI